MVQQLARRLTARHRFVLSLACAVVGPALVLPACGPGDLVAPGQPYLMWSPPPPGEVRGGQSVTLTAAIQDGSNFTGHVVYSLPDQADQQVATINPTTGVLTAATALSIAQKVVTVQATTDQPNGPPTITAQLLVRTRIDQITLAAPQTTLTVGGSGATTPGSAQVTPTVAYAPGSPSVPPAPAPTFTWTSSAPTVVSVSPTGVITALAPTNGVPVSIRAVAEGVTSAPIQITVNAAPSIALVVDPRTLAMRVGDAHTFTATLANATGAITWTARTAGVLSLAPSASGGSVTATAAAVGSTYLVASFTSGTTTARDSALVTVAAAQPPSIVLSPRSLTLGPTQTGTLTATIANAANGLVLGFTSTVPAVADVASSAGGTVTVRAGSVAGTTQLIASLRSGTTIVAADTVPVTVLGGPTIAFTPSPVTVGVAGTAQVTTTVSNPLAGGALSLVVRPAGFATYSPSTNNNTTAVGSIVGSAAGSSYLVATYTAGGTVVTDSVKITVGASVASRVARVVLEPRDQEVTAPTPFTYRPRFLDANGVALTAADLTADGGTVRFFNTSDAVATVVQLTSDQTQAQVTPKGAGTEDVTVVYQKGGQTIASDNSKLTVYAAGTAGHYGSLTISTGGNVRQLKVGETVLFQVVVRDPNSVILTSGVTGLTVASSDTSVLTVARDGSPNGYFYTMTGVKPGVVTLRADVAGAATSIVIAVTP